jgi:hypothetical protein
VRKAQGLGLVSRHRGQRIQSRFQKHGQVLSQGLELSQSGCDKSEQILFEGIPWEGSVLEFLVYSLGRLRGQ